MHPRDGGPPRTVGALCAYLRAIGVEASIVTGARRSSSPCVTPPQKVPVYAGVGAHRPRRWLACYRTLQVAISDTQPALLHSHGLWEPMHLLTAGTAFWRDIPLVVSVRGMLTPWALDQSPAQKQVAWWAYQRMILNRAALLHATSDEEAAQLRCLGLQTPITVIPNGVEVPQELPSIDKEPGTPCTALFLSRIHPKKGLPMLLQAWNRVRPEGWRLRIVGPDETNHVRELRQQVQKLGLEAVIEFVGPVSDTEKWSYYREADLFVLPTHSENFGVVVAEALAAGTPVLTTRGAPWQDLLHYDCGWWTEINTDALADALAEAVKAPAHVLHAMGRKGQRLVLQSYTWQATARKIAKFYHDLVCD